MRALAILGPHEVQQGFQLDSPGDRRREIETWVPFENVL
jgi:hypothetical protein